MTTNETNRIVRWLVIIVLALQPPAWSRLAARKLSVRLRLRTDGREKAASSAGPTSQPICGKCQASSSSPPVACASRSALR